MVQRGHRATLGQEPLALFGLAGLVAMQQLDGNGSVQGFIESTVDDPHGSFAHAGLDPVFRADPQQLAAGRARDVVLFDGGLATVAVHRETGCVYPMGLARLQPLSSGSYHQKNRGLFAVEAS